jgi:hypothetical protein
MATWLILEDDRFNFDRHFCPGMPHSAGACIHSSVVTVMLR